MTSCIHCNWFCLSHLGHLHWIQTQFICLWPITIYFKGLYFLPIFLSLDCHHFNVLSMFIVLSVHCYIQFYWIQVSASVFIISLSSSITWLTTGFLLLSPIFYTCSIHVHNHTQFIPTLGYIYNFPSCNTLPYIYFHNIRLHLYI